MTPTVQRHSSYLAGPVRRIEDASAAHLCTLPRLQARSWISRWLKGKPPAQIGEQSIQAPSYEGVLSGLNFWDRANGSVGDRQSQLRDSGTAAWRPLRLTYGGKW